MKASSFFFLSCFACFVLVQAFQPDQVHSAWTGVDGERIFSFVTPVTVEAQVTTIQYGLSSSALTLQATGTNFVFGTRGHNFTINNVLIQNLKPETYYYYRVGDSRSSSWSEVFSFQTKTKGVVYAVYGDFGEANDRSLDRLIEETKKEIIDAVLHVGDFAYDLDSQDGKVGDAFMNSIQPIASALPYMTCPGNHEAAGNFSHYRNRFSLIQEGVGKNSQSQVNLWYSFNLEYTHFVAIDTEVYHYFRDDGQIQRQLNWLEKDLQDANKNRDQYPWIVMYGHKGWFMDSVNYTGFEDLAHAYGVDLFLCGHVHNYERFYPQHHGKVDSQEKHHYTNPKYMTTIVAGSPGCREKISHGSGPAKALAEHSLSYGYGHLKILNATHLTWEWQQTSKEAAREVLDHLTIVQNHHGPRK
jgi:predicted MPP superfamily phosphohydrolase